MKNKEVFLAATLSFHLIFTSFAHAYYPVIDLKVLSRNSSQENLLPGRLTGKQP